MGRNKNKENRSSARKNNGVAATGSKKRDTGLPTYFKQRKINSLASKEGHGKTMKNQGDEMEVDDIDLESSSLDSIKINGKGVWKGNDVVGKDSFLLDKAARDLSLIGKRDSSAKAFMKDVKNVVENSDVILQVLDARDPLGSRSRQTEVMALGSGKKMVLILNKVDLVPISNLQGWLKYLRNDFPTLAFKASTQQQRGNLKQGNASLSLQQTHKKMTGQGSSLSFGSEAVGAAALLQLLKNYSRTTAKGSNLKQQLTVGVIGPPNVGKSSLINSLLRTRACAVASTPGWTKVIQGVMLEKGIRLLDCPGVVVSGGSYTTSVDGEKDSEKKKMDNAWSVLRNTVKVELIEDPITPVQALMSRVEPDQLSKLYNIEGGFNEGDGHDFLLRVALMRGKLGKGGIPDLEGAARIVLHDWNIGRISYHTKVPAVHPSALIGSKLNNQEMGAGDNTAGTSLVGSLGEAFDLEALLGQADAEALGGDDGKEGGKILFEPRERRLMPIAEGSQDSAIVEEDDQGQDRTVESLSSSLGKRRRDRDAMDSDSDSESEVEKAKALLDLVDGDEDYNDHIQTKSSHTKTDELVGEYYNRRQQKAESISHRKRDLLTVFSPIELEGMAQRRSDVRKAAKKKKKRLHRSEAGLVDVWNKGMALPSDESKVPSQQSKGLFVVVDQTAQEEEEL